MNSDRCMSVNPSLDFSPSSLHWNLGLGDILPGSATDVAKRAETDGFPPLGTGFYNQFNVAESQANPVVPGIPALIPLIQSTVPALQPPPAFTPGPAMNQNRIPCSILGCPVFFNRDGDRIRHEASVHGFNQALQLHLCPILNCPKSQGAGYTRKDKLTEHMWKKHSDLGFMKKVL